MNKNAFTTSKSNPNQSLKDSLQKRFSSRLGENIIGIILLACAAVSVLTTAGVVISLGSETISFFADPLVSVWSFLTDREWTPFFSEKHFGITPLIVGTLLVTVISLVVGIPLGLGSAIFLSEFATDRTRRIIMPILEILAGIPTVVLGYFALFSITPILKSFIPGLGTQNALAAGIVMGFMILPTISSISVDSMQAVPGRLREAAYGLGSTKAEVITKVVLPAALSGIVASIILAMSRAIGETMVVTLAAGARPVITFDPRDAIATMTAFIANAAQSDQEAGSVGAKALFAVGATLFLITLLLNIISHQVVARFSEKYD
ncbi:MAG: phosphate ABC transporter permease subunit PstC [Trueperaceae bacterium]|nr:phosphate ABC transporter permease subunit PstC [Trueperaceae bacterium]